MFKKALQIAATLGLLVGGYAGYTRLFAVVAGFVDEGRPDTSVPFRSGDTRTARDARQLARESFGATHFAAGKDLPLQYYEATRGYYLYAQHYERLEDGKRLHLWPFAVIAVSGDGKNRKTIVSDDAIIDSSGPLLTPGKPGSPPSKIVHAKLLGNVWIRDDKGTPGDPTDDLHVGPMTSLDYDDKALQITSDSDIILEDRDLKLTGIGMMIQLRRKVATGEPGGGGGSGFETETAFVYKDVHIVVRNVGSNGILPGTAKPEKTGRTPLDLRCDREMKVEFPRPRDPVAVGPPDLDAAPDPTFARFRTNVRVLRGTDKTDQLNCDTLDLTLMPNPRPPSAEPAGDRGSADPPLLIALATPAPAAEPAAEPGDSTAPAPDPAPAPAASSGPLTELKLRKAFARGDAVWLQSEASGMVARCHELHYEKHVEEGTPDVTYLNGGARKLWVEKVDYDNQAPTPGTIKSIMTLNSTDATIFDFGPGGASKVIARGPGKTEDRPARNASVARTVWFEDEMQLLTWRDGDGAMPSAAPDAVRALKSAPPAPPRGTLRRLVTLLGVSKLVDHGSATTLDARKSIVAEFQATKGCDLQLIPEANHLGALPSNGKNLVVVAATGRGLHFRVLDPAGRLVEDADEASLAGQAEKIADLKKRLAGLWPPHEFTLGEKAPLINLVGSILEPSPGRPLPDPKDGATEIKWLDAHEDAHLTAPGRALTARQFLKAKFETRPRPTTPAPVTGPLVAVAVAVAPAPAEGPEQSPLAPPEPAIDGRADRVWASILLGEPDARDSRATKGELKDAQLRGGVMVHQEPAAGKTFGSDASGEALDITGQGNGLMKFAVKAEEPPQAFDPRTKLASSSKGRRAASSSLVARVEFEGKIVESVDIIGLDQKLDLAWSDGAGIYIQMADGGLLDDKGISGERPAGSSRPAGPTPKDRLVITWTDQMRFIGNSKDLENRPAAKIEFRGTSKDVWTPDNRSGFRRGVEAKMTSSLIVCDSMDVYMDKTIALNKDTRKPSPRPPDEPAPSRAEIAMLDCRGRNLFKDNGDLRLPGVDVISEKSYADFELFPGQFKEKQRIWSEHVVYDKRTGDFEAPGPGTTWLYKRKAVDPKNPRKVPNLELTKVKYAESMRGRFGVAKDQAGDNQRREARFLGAAEAANGTVGSKNSDLDFDQPKTADYMFLSSDDLHVYSYPPPITSKASARQLLNARGNGVARSVDSLIQADLITYDSESELIYSYGQEGKEVSLTRQESPGQIPSTNKMKQLRFNKRTHESSGTDPQTITFADLKTGLRPKSLFPDLGGTPKLPDPLKTQRTPLQKPARTSTERKTFSSNGQ